VESIAPTAPLLLAALPLSFLLLLVAPKWFGRIVALAYLPLGLSGALYSVTQRRTFRDTSIIPLHLHLDAGQHSSFVPDHVHAFASATWIGSGIGTAPAAAATHSLTAANSSAMSLAAGGGVIALLLTASIVALAVKNLGLVPAALKGTLVCTLLLGGFGAFVGVTGASRAVWFLIGIAAVAVRLTLEDRDELVSAFDPALPRTLSAVLHHTASRPVEAPAYLRR
jgi:hypothetical protein